MDGSTATTGLGGNPAGGLGPSRSRLAEVLRRDGRLFFRLAYNVVRDAQAAEDVCQQAALRAWERGEELKDPAALRAWVARVVVNESLTLVRRRIAERRAMRALAVAGHQASPLEGLGLRDDLLWAMAKLPEEVREAVTLRFLSGMSGNQAKELLGCSAAEVSRRLHQGLEQLRGLLSDRGRGF